MVAVTRSVHGRGWNHTSSGVTDSVTRGAHIFFMLTIKTSLWRQVPLTAQISLWCNGYTLFKKYLPNHMNIHGQDDCGVLVPSSLEPRMFFLRRPEKKIPGHCLAKATQREPRVLPSRCHLPCVPPSSPPPSTTCF
jgi:hypothetical protein